MPRTLSEPEFNAIRDKVLAAAPAGLTEAEYQRYIGPAMAQAIGEAENSAPALEGSATSRFAAGAGEMLNPVAIAQGLYGAVRHPIDTVTNIGKASLDQGRQAVDLAKQGRYTEALGHTMAMTPIIGPAAAGAGEQIATGDVAGGLGKGFGLLVPAMIPSAVRVAGKVTSALPEAVATAAEESAASRVAGVMAPKVGANKVRFGGMAEKAAPALAKDLAEGGAPWSREGLHAQVSANLATAEQALDAASDARLAARTFPTQPLIEELLQKRRLLTSQAVEGSSYPRTPAPQGTLAHHGSPNQFNQFSMDKAGTTTDAGQLGRGIYASSDRRVSAAYPNQYEADVMLKNPIRVEIKDLGQRDKSVLVKEKLGLPKTATAADISAAALKQGHDGVILDYSPSGYAHQEYAVFTEHGIRMMPKPSPIGADVVPGPNSARVAVIDRAIRELKQLGPVARYEPIRRLRQAYDGPAKAVYAPAVTADYLKAQGGKLGAADVTGVLRSNLAKWDPTTAEANGQYALYRSADDVMNATAEVERTRPKVGRQIMTRLTTTIAGEHAAGIPGAITGFVFAPAVDAALSSGVTTQLKTAAVLQRLAFAIRKGDFGYVNALSAQLKRLGMTAAAVQGGTTSPSGSQSQTTAPITP